MLFESLDRQRANGRVLEAALQHSKLVNRNGAKSMECQQTYTEARTKMEVYKLRTKAEQ